MSWKAMIRGRVFEEPGEEKFEEALEEAYRMGRRDERERLEGRYGERGGSGGGSGSGGSGGYGQRDGMYMDDDDDFDYGERRGVRGTGRYSRLRRR